jgi:hypothetical protein
MAHAASSTRKYHSPALVVPALSPALSPLGNNRGDLLWKPFVEDEDTQSYSYYLEADNNRASPVFTPEQLDRWFRELHPSSYCSSADAEDADASWTEASYQGERLLRQTAWCVFADGCTCEYGYSDTWQSLIQSTKMKSLLNEITKVVSKIVGGGILLNSCNLNYYPRGG